MLQEPPWVEQPGVLVLNFFRINPFGENLTRAERLNAHARLTILLGASAAYIFAAENNKAMAKLVAFWTVVLVLSQGVDYTSVGQVSPPPLPPAPAPAPTSVPAPTQQQIRPQDVPLWKRWQIMYGGAAQNAFDAPIL